MWPYTAVIVALFLVFCCCLKLILISNSFLFPRRKTLHYEEGNCFVLPLRSKCSIHGWQVNSWFLTIVWWFCLQYLHIVDFNRLVFILISDLWHPQGVCLECFNYFFLSNNLLMCLRDSDSVCDVHIKIQSFYFQFLGPNCIINFRP